MKITDIQIHMFQPNLLVNTPQCGDQEKLKKAITYHDYVRQCWINYKKKSSCDESQTIDIQYQASIHYLDSICQQFKSEIKILSFQFLTDVINWFHSNKISFIVHDFHEYEVNSMSVTQLDSLNESIATKYGQNIKFIHLN